MSNNQDIYTNSVRVSASVYEITMIFSVNTLGENGQVSTEEVARVRMSPQHAVAMSILLNRNLKAYGDQFKEIFLPDELIKKLSGEIGEEAGHGT